VRLETKSGHMGGQNIPISQVHGIANMTLLDLLTSINLYAQAGETIVTVNHGNAQGFSFPLVAGTGVHGTRQALTDLMSTIPSDQLQIPNVSSEQVDQMRTLMTAIRAKQLAGIEIRACNMGNLQTLEVLRGFFGCQYVAAPIVTDFFTAIPAVNQRTPAQMQILPQANLRCYMPPQSGGTPGGPDLCVSFQNVGGSSYGIVVYALPGTEPRARWMRTFFAAAGAFQPPQPWLTGGFVIHGVVLTNVLRLPAETEYRNNIQVYPGAV
jgi:hypothetical protein